MLASAQNTLATHQNIAELTNMLPDMILTISTAAANIKDSATQQVFTKLYTYLETLKTTLTSHAEVITNLNTRTTTLELHLTKIIPELKTLTENVDTLMKPRN